jgi:hypothetical protein
MRNIELRKRLIMKTTLKVVLSAAALATLMAASALAKSHPLQHNTQPPIYSNNTAVVVDGKVIGADPDSFIRSQIGRENRSYIRD